LRSACSMPCERGCSHGATVRSGAKDRSPQIRCPRPAGSRWWNASARSATAGTSAPWLAAPPEQNRGPRFRRDGSGTAGQASSIRPPKARDAAAHHRRIRNRSVDAGNETRSMATANNDIAESARDRHFVVPSGHTGRYSRWRPWPRIRVRSCLNAPIAPEIGTIWNFTTKFQTESVFVLSLQSSTQVWTRIPPAY
jgi:hypothetical protein